MLPLRRLAMILALGVTLVAPGTPTTFATNLAPDTDPRAFLLEPTDLGSGYRLNSEQSGPRLNDAAGREDAARYQQWGRVVGYHAQFEREPSVLASLTQSGVVIQSVSLYRNSEGARAAFDYSRQRNGQTMELLGTPLIGEASLAFRARMQPGQPGASATAPRADAVVIQFRKGNLVQSVVVSGPEGAPVFDEALALAQAAAGRVPD